jgi:outer membrane lipoprotein SlyB
MKFSWKTWMSTLLLALMASACKTTETRITTYDSPGSPERVGQVAWIKETQKDEKGNPVGGAALGATIGGLAGYAIGGGVGGVVIGAVGGGATGALLSKGDGEKHWFDVNVKFDDGGEQVFRFDDSVPFVVGERVGVVGNTVRSLVSKVTGPAGQPPKQQPASEQGGTVSRSSQGAPAKAN